MATTVEFKTKEFKEILKAFSKFAQHSHKKPTVSIAFDPVRLIMITDHAYVSAKPTEVMVSGDEEAYCFNPEILLGLTLRGENVSLSWQNESSVLSLINDNLSTTLRVALPHPKYDALPSDISSTEIPLGTLVAIAKFLSIPFSFDNRKKELMPVRFWRGPNDILVASADDGYSLAKITTGVPVTTDFDIKVPKYILDCIYSKGSFTDVTPIKIGMKELKSLFSNGTIQIFSSGMTDESSNFDMVLYDFKAKTSFTFNPKTLAQAIKPLVDLIPKKERGGTIVKMSVSDKMSMTVKHKDVGEGKVDKVDDIDKIYNEDAAKSTSVAMHPQSFQDYTNLFSVEKGYMFANSKMVHYEGTIEAGGAAMKIEYLFPTVQE